MSTVFANTTDDASPPFLGRGLVETLCGPEDCRRKVYRITATISGKQTRPTFLVAGDDMDDAIALLRGAVEGTGRKLIATESQLHQEAA